MLGRTWFSASRYMRERVTAGEIRDACSAPLPARDLDGVRRRTRALAGRCQGFYCSAEVIARVADGTGFPPGVLLGSGAVPA